MSHSMISVTVKKWMVVATSDQICNDQQTDKIWSCMGSEDRPITACPRLKQRYRRSIRLYTLHNQCKTSHCVL